MAYPEVPDFSSLSRQLVNYSKLKHEYGSKGIQPLLEKAEDDLKEAIKKIKALPIDKKLAAAEPNKLKAIKALRPKGPRCLWTQFDMAEYKERMEGALLGRMAGCTLGAPVEFWPIEKMSLLAQELDTPFPPVDYWTRVPDPLSKRYDLSTREEYTRDKMNGVPVDDDIAYTLLGLLIVEEFGLDFTTADVGKAWIKYLPIAYTAEKIALDNLKAGVPAKKAGKKDNPCCEWIGADIRSDPWGYMAPGYPEYAADMAYRDAYISHRRQGIYGEMYFSAAIAAAFAVDDPVQALRIGLTEIPKKCALAKGVRWALKVAPEITTYQQARDAVEEKFKGMMGIHTIKNACLTIWGITIGGRDFTKVISETVAMGLDNDCTTATAGSIVGAVVGKQGIPEHWTKNFDNTVHSYLIGQRRFSISDLVSRFAEQARMVWS